MRNFANHQDTPDMTWLILTGVSAGAFLCVCVGVAAILRYARGEYLLDIPNERSSHTHPVPRGGGLPVVGVVIVGSAIATGWMNISTANALTLIAAAAVAALGWLDDVHTVSAMMRLMIQTLIAAGVVTVVGWPTDVLLPIVGELHLGLWGGILALIWIVGLINAYNFMDGIDGIAGSVGVVAGLGWTIIGVLGNEPFVTIIGALIAASCLAFLLYNWSPAKIFMGDVGSTFLGFIFAVLPVWIARRGGGAGFAGMLLVAPFVLDTSITLIRRAWRREKVLEAHRSHFYQRLVQQGYPMPGVAIAYAGVAALAGFAGILWWQVIAK
jgi:Fuc2NAc and GlcNAc transferase